ncbi:hypothetical protein Tco_0785679 [Tanacetum coccineum]
MSSDNTSPAVTYMSISSDSNRPSWGIPLVNVGELPEMDPNEEVAQQGQAPPLSPTYVPDPMESRISLMLMTFRRLLSHLDTLLIKSPLEEDSIDYPDEPKDDNEDPEEDANEDPEEDPSEEHEAEDDDEDPEEDPNKEHDPEDEDTKEEEPSEGSDETEPFEEDETTVTPPPTRHRRARISIRPQTPMTASTQELIDAFATGSPPFPLPPTSPTYDQAPLKSFVAAAARPPKAQAADRVEDVGYVKALQASEHRMMTSIKEVNLRVSYQAQVCKKESEDFHTQLYDARTDRKDIRLKIDVRAKDDAVRQMMRIYVLEARAKIDAVEDTDSSC